MDLGNVLGRAGLYKLTGGGCVGEWGLVMISGRNGLIQTTLKFIVKCRWIPRYGWSSVVSNTGDQVTSKDIDRTVLYQSISKHS